MKKLHFKMFLFVMLGTGLFLTSCSEGDLFDSNALNEQEIIVLGAGDKTATPKKITKYDVPTISEVSSSQYYIDLKISAGPSGAPAGFTIHWAKKSDYVAASSNWDLLDAGLKCAAGFSGNAFISRYNLTVPSGEFSSVTVRIGDFLYDNGASTNCPSELECNTEYVFRVFAHATNDVFKSDFGDFLTVKTADCPTGDTCLYSMKNFIDNPTTWAHINLKLGDREYSSSEMLNILNVTGGNNGLLAIAHNLIVVKLNIALGASFNADMTSSINAADNLIGLLVVPPIGTGYLAPNTQGLNKLAGDLNGYRGRLVEGFPCN